MPFLFKIYFAMMLHQFGAVPATMKYGSNYPQFIQSPLEIPIELAGNFGEIRENHFHTGWDIKTQNKEGLPVKAAAIGYVSRIKISSTGYGVAIYVTHPQGFVTVYGHLNHLEKRLADLVKAEQYRQKSFEVDIKFPVRKYVVKTGEVIAYSGNSGGSTAPHLHFEVRDAFTEEAINPTFFGLQHDDNVAPTIQQIGIYSWNYSFAFHDFQTAKDFEKRNDTLFLKEKIEVENPFVAFAINAFDHDEQGDNFFGIYNQAIYADGKLLQHLQFDKLIFAQQNMINGMIDFERQRLQKTDWLRLFKLEGVENEVIKSNNSGILQLNDGEEKNIVVNLNDERNNTTVLCFRIFAHINSTSKYQNKNYFAYDKSYFDLIPAHTFFSDVPLQYFEKLSAKNQRTAFILDTKNNPPKSKFTVRIKAENYLANSPQTLMISESRSYGKNYHNVKWQHDTAVASVKEFGKFYLTKDENAPTVSWKNEHDNFAIGDKLFFKIDDKESGIKKYQLLVNDDWRLISLDAKNNLLTIEIDNHWTTGEQNCVLIVGDYAGNKTEKRFSFSLKTE